MSGQVPITIIDPETIDEIAGWFDRREAGSLTPRGTGNKVKEKVGEIGSIKRIRKKFPGIGDPLVVVRRANDVPVLDLLFRKFDGTFVIVEAKFSSKGKLRLGTTNAESFLITDNGLVPIKVKGGRRQMSPGWMEDRLRELNRLGKHQSKEARQLAKTLNNAIHTGKFEAYSIVIDKRGNFVMEHDHTPDWKDHFTKKGTEARNTPNLRTSGAVKDEPASNRKATENRLSGPDKNTLQKGPGKTTKTSRLADNVPDLRTKPGKIASKAAKGVSKLRLGFGADLIVTLATEIMLGILESKLQEVNDEGIRREYGDKVYKGMRTSIGETLMQAVNKTVLAVQQGVFEGAARGVGINPNLYMYFRYQYDVLMERQAKDISDAIVSIIRGFDFVEVYHDLNPVGQVSVTTSKTPLKSVISRDKRREIRTDIFRYRYTHKMLVWDPEVKKLYYRLWNSRVKLLNLLSEKIARSGPIDKEWATEMGIALKELVNQYRFLEGIGLLNEIPIHQNDLPKARTRERNTIFMKVAAELLKAELDLKHASNWSGDRQVLLSLYLDTDPFPSRLREIRKDRENQKRRLQEYKQGRVERAEASYTVDPETGRVLSKRMK